MYPICVMQEYLPLNGVVLLLFCAVFNYIAVHLLFSSLFLESSFLIIFVMSLINYVFL